MTEYPAGWTCELTLLRLERYLGVTASEPPDDQ